MFLIPVTLCQLLTVSRPLRPRGTVTASYKSDHIKTVTLIPWPASWDDVSLLWVRAVTVTAQSQEQWSREAQGAYTVLPKCLVCRMELMCLYWQSRTISRVVLKRRKNSQGISYEWREVTICQWAPGCHCIGRGKGVGWIRSRGLSAHIKTKQLLCLPASQSQHILCVSRSVSHPKT